MADASSSQNLISAFANIKQLDSGPGGSNFLETPSLDLGFPSVSTEPSKSSVHFSSQSCEWATPLDFFQALDREFGFDLDVCATPSNAKCKRYYTRHEDGLVQPWFGTCWCNPPYGREISLWVEKAMRSAKEGRATVVCLVPARTDTKWWHDYVSQAAEVRFVKGRLKFGGHKNSAPFPSAVVVFAVRVPVQPPPLR